MDEHGIALGVCSNSQVTSKAGRKKAYIKSPKNREWVSIIETVNANGQPNRPYDVRRNELDSSIMSNGRYLYIMSWAIYTFSKESIFPYTLLLQRRYIL